MEVHEGSSSVVPSKRRRAQDPEHKDSVSDLAKEPGHPFDLSVLDSLRAHVSKVKVDLSEWTAQEPADAAGLPVSQQPGAPVDEAGLMVENINSLRAHISRVKSDLSKWLDQEPADPDVNGLPVVQQSGAPVNEARLQVEGVDPLHIHTAQNSPEIAESTFSKHPRALKNLQQAPQQAGSGILAILDTDAAGSHENNSSVVSSKRRRTEASEPVAKEPERHYFDLSMLDKVMAPVSEAEIPMEGVDSLRGHVSKVKYDLSKREPQEDEKGGDEEDHEAFLSMKAVHDPNSMDVDIPASNSLNLDPLASKLLQGRTDSNRAFSPAPTIFDRDPPIPEKDVHGPSTTQPSMEDVQMLLLQRIMHSAELGRNVKKYVQTTIAGRKTPLIYPLSKSQQLEKWQHMHNLLTGRQIDDNELLPLDYFKDDPNYIYIKQEFMEAMSQDIQEDMDEYLQLTKEIADLKAALGLVEEAFTTRSSFLSKQRR
ncbi:hypothetical protein PHLCEN_2v12425 [Hermanssonia centrifuga]|uniref:Uncharacterized protein n=1 Tax=Hermanssonia centrifuga TaxID=98765 RepID=A0A2R6NHF4_9APHY|nr:hypothetical protein PHLCEN_2v12425 [Hermanssonia centrifuga]